MPYSGRPPAFAALLLCLVMVPTGCASRHPELAHPAERPGEEEIDAVASLLRLEDSRDYDPVLLQTSAASPSPVVRRRAALALGRVGGADAPLLLRSLLTDRDTGVAATAAFALGEIADSGAVPALQSLLVSQDSGRVTVAAEAASALGTIASEPAVSALRSYLGSAPQGSAGIVTAAALLGVWRSPGPPEIASIARWIHSPDRTVRWSAAYALTRRPSATSVPLALRLSRDPDPTIRSAAFRALTAALVDSAGLSRDSAVSRLLEALREADYGGRMSAVRALGSYSTDAITDTLRSLLRTSDDRHLVLVALESLGRQGPAAERAAGDLEVLALSAEAADFHRQVALESLARVRPTNALSVARRAGHHHPLRMRGGVARATVAGLPAARADFERLLSDPDPRVVTATLQAAVDAAGDSLRPLLPLLVSQLGARDFIVRTTALTALARLRDPSSLSLLLDAYGLARADSSNDAALAAVDALGRLREQGTDVSRAFFARFDRPADYLVRRRVVELFGATALTAWGPPAPVDSLAAPAEYRTMAETELGLRPLPPDLLIRTDAGDVRVRLFDRDAPLTARNFRMLAERGYFDGQEWPRVVPNFVVQGGDPRGDMNGGPGYTIRDEINRRRYGTGTLGMALSGPDTGGSQFFITHSPQPHLDGIYTVFGEVVEGHAVLERILPGDVIQSVRVTQ